MNRPELEQRVRKDVRGALRVSPLVLVSLVLVALFWRTDSAANTGFFQSSPVETPLPSLTPTSTSEPAPITPSPVLSETPLASPGVTLTAEATETSVPVETASPTASPVSTEPSSTDTPVASATSEPAEPEPTADENQRYPEGESNLRFEWGMLFDSMALFFSYVWLCCGILLFIAVPLFFFILWRAGARRGEEVGQEED